MRTSLRPFSSTEWARRSAKPAARNASLYGDKDGYLPEAPRRLTFEELRGAARAAERCVMTAVSNRESEEPAPRCPQCGAFGEFGYRDVYGAMGWFCARHRLAQFWADARIAISTRNEEVLIDDNDHQQIDRAPAEPAAGSFSYPADGLSWDRAGPDVDGPRLARRPAGTRRQLTAVAHDRTPHFDAAGQFIHPCSNCGREAILGTRVNLLAGQLGTWYCGVCKSPPSP